MPRAAPTFDSPKTVVAYAVVVLTEVERADLDRISTKPGFADAVASLAAYHRAAIAYENELPTNGPVRANLREIKRRAEKLSADVISLLTLTATVDERTAAKLREAGLGILEYWLGNANIPTMFAKNLQKTLGVPVKGKRQKSVAPRRAGEAVKRLFHDFDLNYAVIARRRVEADEVGTYSIQDSPAVAVFRIVTGIQTDRVEDYLP